MFFREGAEMRITNNGAVYYLVKLDKACFCSFALSKSFCHSHTNVTIQVNTRTHTCSIVFICSAGRREILRAHARIQAFAPSCCTLLLIFWQTLVTCERRYKKKTARVTIQSYDAVRPVRWNAWLTGYHCLIRLPKIRWFINDPFNVVQIFTRSTRYRIK